MTNLLLFFLFLMHSAIIMAEECNIDMSVATASLPPLVVYKQDNPLEGKVIKNLDKLLNKDSIDKIKVYPWARALGMAKSGHVDGLFPVIKSSEREEYLHYLTPSIGSVILSLYEAHDSVTSSEQSNKIAIMRSLQFDKTQLPNSKFYEVITFKQAIDMLKARRVQYIVGVKEIINAHLSESDSKTIKWKKDVATQPIYFTLTKNSPNFLQLKECMKL